MRFSSDAFISPKDLVMVDFNEANGSYNGHFIGGHCASLGFGLQTFSEDFLLPVGGGGVKQITTQVLFAFPVESTFTCYFL